MFKNLLYQGDTGLNTFSLPLLTEKMIVSLVGSWKNTTNFGRLKDQPIKTLLISLSRKPESPPTELWNKQELSKLTHPTIARQQGLGVLQLWKASSYQGCAVWTMASVRSTLISNILEGKRPNARRWNRKNAI